MTQNPFIEESASNIYAENPEPRCPSLLLLDVSGSMQGEPIKELQEGLGIYRDSLFADSLAKKRVEVAVMTFGGQVELVAPFSTADAFVMPTLQATADTPMAQAVVEGLQYLENHKAVYRQNGISYFRPWVFLISDGAPTDKGTNFWEQAKQLVKDGEIKKSFTFFAVGVQGADMECLAELSAQRAPLTLKGLEFKKLFEWLSASQQAVSRSTPGDTVDLPSPAGWAQIS